MKDSSSERLKTRTENLGKKRLTLMAQKFSSDVTVIGGSIYSRFNKLERSRKKLFGPCKSPLPCLGVLKANLVLKGKSCVEDVYVVENLETPLLGRSACLALETIAKVAPVTQPAEGITVSNAFQSSSVAWVAWTENMRSN